MRYIFILLKLISLVISCNDKIIKNSNTLTNISQIISKGELQYDYVVRNINQEKWIQFIAYNPNYYARITLVNTTNIRFRVSTEYISYKTLGVLTSPSDIEDSLLGSKTFKEVSCEVDCHGSCNSIIYINAKSNTKFIFVKFNVPESGTYMILEALSYTPNHAVYAVYILIPIVIIVILVIIFLVWKWRKNKYKNRTDLNNDTTTPIILTQ